MEHVKLLDCTLRDGAYLIEKKFGNTVIKGIIDGLIKANIDYIEIGFFQNNGFGEGKTVYKNSEEAQRFIPDKKGRCKFTVLADYSRYSVDNLDECTGESVDAIRECFFKEERYDAIQACKVIKEKGYKLFIQPVDILGYSDLELIEFIEIVNEIEPYCFSIVDTFGSMYQEDLHRVFEIINHNLISSSKIGFHSHNNMQLSSALSQEFIRISTGKRNVVIDGTISGMGRGAGNTPTELIAQYLVSQLGYAYDMNHLLDLIDTYMDNIRSKCSWGYSTSYFTAGCYGAHVNNIDFLSKKNSIRHKDICLILNKLGANVRKRYDYDLLEKTYMEIMQADIDDKSVIQELQKEFGERTILVLLPGKTLEQEEKVIKRYIIQEKPVIISVNFMSDRYKCDYIYMNNVKRYKYWSNNENFLRAKKIITSNILQNDCIENVKIVSFTKLVKCGWDYLDNSALMLLRLLDIIDVAKIAIAGFDGFSNSEGEHTNYFKTDMEVLQTSKSAAKVNQEIREMLLDYKETRKNKEIEIKFLTPSRFENVFYEV